MLGKRITRKNMNAVGLMLISIPFITEADKIQYGEHIG